MTLLDLAIIFLVILEVVRGFEIGLFRQGFSLAGFWGGMILGASLAPWAASGIHDAGAKLLIIVSLVFGLGLIIGALGEWIGMKLALLAERWRLGKLDRLGGGALGAVVSLIFVWLGAAMLSNVPVAGVSQAIHRSTVIRTLDNLLPPAPPYLARIQRLLDPNGFPQVFIGLEPTPSEPLNPASSSEVAQALKADAASVVKIEGAACEALVEGTGFVSAPGIVVTNAHVVAGVGLPVIIDGKGNHAAETIYFDPNLDLAVLRTSGLAGAPLPIAASDVNRGTTAVVLGYPHGGPLTGLPAAVLRKYIATGRNIYDRGIVSRTIYELSADVQPGNSGGPLVLPDGTVIGVIFAKSQGTDEIGYSLTSSEVLPKIRAAESNGPVSTGPCAAD